VLHPWWSLLALPFVLAFLCFLVMSPLYLILKSTLLVMRIGRRLLRLAWVLLQGTGALLLVGSVVLVRSVTSWRATAPGKGRY